MRKLNLNLILMVILCTIAIMGCKKDFSKNQPNGILQFGFVEKSKDVTKTTKSDNTATPRYVILTLLDSKGNFYFNQEKIPLLMMGGTYISKTISITPDEYELTEFFVTDSVGNVIYATPKQDSDLARFVKSPLPVPIHISAESVYSYVLEVLDSNNSIPTDFGYVSFNLAVLDPFLISVFGYNNSQLYKLSNASVTIIIPYHKFSKYALSDGTNTLYVSHKPDKYIIEVHAKGYKSWVDTFSRDQMNIYGKKPVVVNLESFGNNSISISAEGTFQLGGMVPFNGFGFTSHNTNTYYVDWGDGNIQTLSSESQSFGLWHQYLYLANRYIQVYGAVDDIKDIDMSTSKFPPRFDFIDFDISNATGLETLLTNFINGDISNLNLDNMTHLRKIELYSTALHLSLNNCIGLESILAIGPYGSVSCDLSSCINMQHLQIKRYGTIIFGENPQLTDISDNPSDSLFFTSLLESVKQFPRKGNLSNGFQPTDPAILVVLKTLRDTYGWTISPDIN